VEGTNSTEDISVIGFAAFACDGTKRMEKQLQGVKAGLNGNSNRKQFLCSVFVVG
jgi:hypothetical protein